MRVARVTGPYGPMERRSEFRPNMSAIHDWTAAALAGRLIKVPDPGLMMDTTHVADVAAAVVKILLADSPHYPIYNVGAEEEHSVGEISTNAGGIGPRFVIHGRQGRGFGPAGATSWLAATRVSRVCMLTWASRMPIH